MAIEPAREAYMVQWIARLLERVKRSGLDSIPFDEAWHHACHPAMVGMPMVDSVLHHFIEAEFRDVAARHFRLEGDSLLVPAEALRHMTMHRLPSSDREARNPTSIPSAFLSYSWDSHQHRAWVRELGARLRRDGVDAKIDQWETAPGDQLPVFMERAVAENDYVLIVCTPRYKARSDSRIGGTGYEGDIMTAEILVQSNHRKFIPLLAAGSWQEAAPTWLGGKYHIDLSGRPSYDAEQYRDLLTTLHGRRENAPPLGEPFSTLTHPAATVDEAETGSEEDEDVRILGVVVDEVTEPSNDGTRGSALYTVPFRLSRVPSYEWGELFVRIWDRPPEWTTMHRPGVASVVGDQVILERTTMEEIETFHRKTLKLALAETNRQYHELLAQQRARADRAQQKAEKHRRDVEERASRINFDDEE